MPPRRKKRHTTSSSMPSASPPSPRRPLLALPADILRQVAQILHDKQALRSLASLGLASHAFHDAICPFLDSHFSIRNRDDLYRLFDRARRTPERLLSVRTLTLHYIPPHRPMSTLRECLDELGRDILLPNVHSVCISASCKGDDAASRGGLHCIGRNDQWPGNDCPTLANPIHLCIPLLGPRRYAPDEWQRIGESIGRISRSLTTLVLEQWYLSIRHISPQLRRLRIGCAIESPSGDWEDEDSLLFDLVDYMVYVLQELEHARSTFEQSTPHEPHQSVSRAEASSERRTKVDFLLDTHIPLLLDSVQDVLVIELEERESSGWKIETSRDGIPNVKGVSIQGVGGDHVCDLPR